MNKLHVGRGTTRGGMTVFPVWGGTTTERDHASVEPVETTRRGDAPVPEEGVLRPSRRAAYTCNGIGLDVTETDDGPMVGALMVANLGDRPALVLEGQLFEGGWQHRMSVNSLMVDVGQRVEVPVACVEQDRWEGETRQFPRGRRVSPWVSEAVRPAARRNADLQSEVWSRVETRAAEQGIGANPTRSFVSRLDHVATEEISWHDAEPLGGQTGVLIGIGGQPYVLEVFDSPATLATQLPSLLESAAVDARSAPQVETPGRRARRFVERLDRRGFERPEPAGVAERGTWRSQYADVTTLRWSGFDVHTRATNVRHPMLVA